MSSSRLLPAPELSALLITPEQKTPADWGDPGDQAVITDGWMESGKMWPPVSTDTFGGDIKEFFWRYNEGFDRFFQEWGSMISSWLGLKRKQRKRVETDGDIYTNVTETKQWVSLLVIPCNPVTRLVSVSGIMSAEEAVLQLIRGHTWQVSQ